MGKNPGKVSVPEGGCLQKFYSKITPQFLFGALLLLIGSLNICYLWQTQGECIDLVLTDKDFYFMDFFNHIFYVREPKNVYDVDYNACFPPLAYMMYWALGKCLALDAVAMNDAPSLSSYALLLYVLYNVAMGILFYNSIERLIRQKGFGTGHIRGIALAIFSSGVYILSILWIGNAALIACILLMRAMELRQRPDRRSQEMALVFIAMAAGFKIYPAIFGILYIKEKRYRKAGRLVLYGVLMFFVLFVFFGGSHGLVRMLKNQAQLHAGISYYSWKSIRSTWNQIDFKFLHFHMPVIGTILTICYAAVAFTVAWLTKVEWKRLYLLCSLMVIVPAWSGSYTPIYFSIPLILFLCGERKEKNDYMYALLFAGMFCFFVWNTPAITNITGDISYVVRYLSIYGMCFLLVVEGMLQTGKELAGRRYESKSSLQK